MATNTDPQLNIEEIRVLLSPYIDGEVTDAERARVEHALRTSPELAAEYESLQQTVAWLTELPPAAAPRPFTLTEADVRGLSSEEQPKPSRWFSLPAWAAGLAAAAAIMFVLLAGGGVLLSVRFENGAQAPSEIAMQQERAAPSMKEAEMAASGAAEADTAELEAAEPLSEDLVEQPVDEAPPAAMVEEEAAVEQEGLVPQPTIAPSVELEQAAPEEQPAFLEAPAKESEPERPLAAEAFEEGEREEEAVADDAAEDAAMMAAPAAGDVGSQAVTDGERGPAQKTTALPDPELAPPAPATTPELTAETEHVTRAVATPSREALAAATTTAVTPTPTATGSALASPTPTATPTKMGTSRSFGSRGISLVLGALAVIIIAGAGVWLLSRRIKEN